MEKKRREKRGKIEGEKKGSNEGEKLTKGGGGGNDREKKVTWRKSNHYLLINKQKLYRLNCNI